jgi:hypothetical protein
LFIERTSVSQWDSPLEFLRIHYRGIDILCTMNCKDNLKEINHERVESISRCMVFGATGDRFVKEGYRPDRNMEDRFKLAASIPGAKGLEMHYPTEVTDENYKEPQGAWQTTWA